MILTTKRHGYHTDYEIGFTPDGKFQYLDCRMFSDGGPYECESYGTLMTGALMSGGRTSFPMSAWRARPFATTIYRAARSRGYGINQAAISIETAMDMMAEKLGIDRSSCAAAMLSTRARRRSAAKCSNTAWA